MFSWRDGIRYSYISFCTKSASIYDLWEDALPGFTITFWRICQRMYWSQVMDICLHWERENVGYLAYRRDNLTSYVLDYRCHHSMEWNYISILTVFEVWEWLSNLTPHLIMGFVWSQSKFHHYNTCFFCPNASNLSRAGPNLFHWKFVKLEIFSCCTKLHDPHAVLSAHFPSNITSTKSLSSGGFIQCGQIINTTQNE